MEIKCVWWDGYHNAFTDIIKHKNKFFITFRHGTKHAIEGKGEIYIISSKDLKKWDLIKKFPALTDSRDPKFFKFRDKIGILFGARFESHLKKIDVYISYSEDGINWGELIKIENYNLWFWRIRNFKEKLYATAYEIKLERGTYLFLSEDGINFKEISKIVDGEYANEGDLLFEDDGLCYAIIRRENFQTPVFAISQPPYKQWKKYILNYIVQGPHIFKFKNEIYIAGRVYIKDGNLIYQKTDGYEPKTAILKMDMKNYKLTPVKILPSSGDTSYCGSIIDDERLFLTYYSQHELDVKESKVEKNASGIYLLTTDSL
ncbi:MAG: hypothetical protein NC827_06080 [Candidatus Omnitrophica bacterium]|nr:hypothetical protein [Candidatus Omnitrophota bacterium]MCM8802858.1 hypothetical protein [Candidatus Omnitrophota bacterium]